MAETKSPPFALTPGLLKSMAEVITIVVKVPKADDVILELMEVDDWTLKGGGAVEEDEGRFVFFGQIFGKIDNGKFIVSRIRPATPAAGKPTIKFKFDGDPSNKIFEFALDDRTTRNEGGYYEICIFAEGIVKNDLKRYITPSPVYVRSTREKRPVISFISDADKKGSANQFFRLAHRFFEKFSDEVADNHAPMGLTDIFDHVRSSARLWGEVNIVSHGNANRLFVRVNSGDKLDGLDADDVAGLARSPRNPLLEPLAPKSVDRDTLVVIRGCQIGKDQALLDRIAELFARNVGGITVLAPKFIQVYETEITPPGKKGRKGKAAPPPPPPQIVERFDEVFDLIFKGSAVPSIDQCRNEVGKQPGMASKDLSRLRIHKTQPEQDVRRYTRANNLADDEDNPKTDAEFEQYARRFDKNFPPVSDKFEWKVSGVARGTDPRSNKRVRLQAFTLTGRRIVVDCRQRLKEKITRSDGRVEEVEVVPDLFNFDHYGRSPRLLAR